ncbi:hypothetical protein B7463_g7080, partial [Scytalidium lignicola]
MAGDSLVDMDITPTVEIPGSSRYPSFSLIQLDLPSRFSRLQYLNFYADLNLLHSQYPDNQKLLPCRRLQTDPIRRLNVIAILKQVRNIVEKQQESGVEVVSPTVIKHLEIWERHFRINKSTKVGSESSQQNGNSGVGDLNKSEVAEKIEQGEDKENAQTPDDTESKKTKPEENVEDDETRRKRKKKEKIKECISEINGMVGLDDVKRHLDMIRAKIETSTRQGVDLKNDCFGTVLIGNPGTGKTTVARNYAKYLSASGVVGSGYKETSGTYLADGGISRIKRYIDNLTNSGGVLFIDNAHQLVSNNSSRGRIVLDFMLEEIERHKGKVLLLLAGYEKGMLKLLGHNHRATANLPHVLKFPEYSNEQLLQILTSLIKKRFDGKMRVEGGDDGLYMRVAARRVGRTRGGPQFGNARAIEHLLARIWERQSARLSVSRKNKEQKAEETKQTETKPTGTKEVEDDTPKEKGENQHASVCKTPGKPDDTPHTVGVDEESFSRDEKTTSAREKETDSHTMSKDNQSEERNPGDNIACEDDDYLFTKHDILGPSPVEAILESPAWKKLQRLTGLECVKQAILSILEVVRSNYQRELDEKPLLQLSFNRLFLGPPGTGKTVVAKLYAQILVEIGALSKGEVIIRNPSDLIGRYIGHSEANTKSVLTAAMGNVLVVDEAHMLYTGNKEGTGNSSDSFRQGVIDTIVSEVQGVPGEDRAVLLLGYGDKMQEMLQNCNPGLSRRFPISDAFWFQNFTLSELESILRSKLEEQVIEATEEAITVAMDVLDKARTRLNFGNGGDVENLISKAKANYQSRVSSLEKSDQHKKWILQPHDFDPEYNRGKSAIINLKRLFSDVVGCDDIVRKLERYQRVSQSLKARNMDPKGYIPTNFIFKGPPGTGKTTTARKIAQVYYDMGFLSEASVVECSVSDLVGRYVGHSGPKTTKVLERGLGKVLFIDEAYRLSSKGDKNSFTSEVVSELVDLLTKPKFHGNLIVILAGYEGEMNQLLSVNPGLASRFPEELNFTSLDTQQCLKVLQTKLGKAGISVPVLSQPKSMEYTVLVRLMGSLTRTASWGNARDVETLSKSLCMHVLAEAQDFDETLECGASMVAATMEDMLQERRARATPARNY